MPLTMSRLLESWWMHKFGETCQVHVDTLTPNWLFVWFRCPSRHHTNTQWREWAVGQPKSCSHAVRSRHVDRRAVLVGGSTEHDIALAGP